MAAAAFATTRRSSDRRWQVRADVNHRAKFFCNDLRMLRNIRGNQYDHHHCQGMQDKRVDEIPRPGLVSSITSAKQRRQNVWLACPSPRWRRRRHWGITFDCGTRHVSLKLPYE